MGRSSWGREKVDRRYVVNVLVRLESFEEPCPHYSVIAAWRRGNLMLPIFFVHGTLALLRSSIKQHANTLPPQLTLSSSVTKNKPIYKLKVRYELPETGKRAIDDQTIEGSFTDWFNVHGYLDKKALRRWLAGNLEVVALADPVAKKEWDDAIEDQRVDEEVVSEGAVRSGAERVNPTTESSAKKRGRPKKL